LQSIHDVIIFMKPINRRAFLQTLGTAGGAALLSTHNARSQSPLPAPSQSGIDHIVVVTMENRSFDHFLGWLPNADGRQSGLSYIDKNNVAHPTYPLAPDYTGCPHPDPDHSYTNSRVAYDSGAMDGFLRAGSNDIYTIGYYTQNDIPFYAALAQNYTACDGYFASILGPTFANRMFLWAAQTDRLDDSISFTSLPTIFDRLSKAGVSHRYFFNNVPYLALWGFKYLTSTGLFSEFLSRATKGTLPSVSFVDPLFTVLDDGTGNDDHPHADIRNGEAFLSTVFHALATGPAWKNTVLIVTFDEWGGFFEHRAPMRVVAPNNVDTDQVNGQVLLGFRVPAVVASPFTRGIGVSHNIFDHTSILKLIEWRWSLAPLTARDASGEIGNLASIMNFTSPDPNVPGLPAVSSVTAAPCFGGGGGIFSSSDRTAQPGNGWSALARQGVVRQFLSRL
jgi:phospholipase C